MKFFRNYILVVLALVIVITLLQKFKVFPSWQNLFSSKPVAIEDTPILVSEIRELAEMITITAFDEVVVDSIKASKYDLVKNLTGFSAPGLSPAADRIVIVTKGKVQAGTDLAYLMPDDIYTNDDSINLVLPPSKILDVISNPSDFSTFIETGDWPPAAVTSLKQKARALILNRALSNGILFRADQRSKLIMENFLRSLGFQKITISIGT